MTRRNYTISEFYCTRCGTKGMPLARKMGKQRENGHLKKIYCLHCKMETNHVEIRPFDYEYTVEDLKRDIENNVYEGRQFEENNKE